MCAVIMTIIRQSINNHTDTYAGISSVRTIVPEVHTVAPSSLSVQWSRNFLDDITSLITDQKQFVDKYVMWIQQLQIQEIASSSIDTWSQWSPAIQPKLPTEPEYQSFEIIKKTLSEKRCDYPLPIDNTDSKLAPHIQWWLGHCLLTVSSAQKVYPDDILTHEMMRVIAQRAWMDVKMEYASSQPVSRDQFLAFFYALQQHHKIGDLPVISMGTPLKRSEYIVFLHKIFWDTLQKITSLTGSWWTGSIPTIAPIWDDTWLSMTVKEFKEILISQWKQLEITPYDDKILLTSDIMKKIISDTSIIPQNSSSSVWIDKEMMKQTLSWFIEKI